MLCVKSNKCPYVFIPVNTYEYSVLRIKHYFKIGGGKGKNYNQIKDIKDSYIAADDIEYGFGNKIPLWLFGFLY